MIILTYTLSFVYFQTELCNMIVDCCAQQRTYEKFYGLLAEVITFRKTHLLCFLII